MLFVGIFSIYAQLSNGGEPLSFQLEKSNYISSIEALEMPFVDEEVLRAEDQILDTLPGMPYRFGFNHEVNLNTDNSGTWDEIPNFGRIWRLKVKSENARSINLTFNNYRLPEGAELFIYNESRTEVLGAFTNENNQEHRHFSTTLIGGDAVTIEYFEPMNAEFEGELNLMWVTHGYRGPKDYLKAFGSSGSCNLNVACPEANGWEDQINSVAMMVTGGSGFCTGTLINNTAEDGTPYFLTADHCYSDPSTWVFWFNWQSATCSNPGSSPSYNSISGATLRARNSTSDFCLVEINSDVPESFGAYWAGWNRTTDATLTETITGIHHPSADIKKFSYATGGVTSANYLGNAGSGTSHWRITWSGGTTTEGGSSGSALFDSNKRIIGQLHGGYAACGNTDPDYYGKLGISWTGGGSNSTRLSNWLDPLNTGVTVLDGIDPYEVVLTTDAQLFAINTPIEEYSSVQQITPQVVIKNTGQNAITSASVSYTIDGGSPVTQAWSGNLASGATTNVSFSPITLTLGNHTFVATVTVSGDEEPANNSMTRNYSVVDCGTPIDDFTYNETFNSSELPLCWTTDDTHASNNWTNTTGYAIGTTYTVDPQTGSNFYYVQWIAANQDEWLITPEFNFTSLTSPEMSFWFNGSYEWSVTQDNCDLDLMVRVNGGAWTKLWGETDHAAFNSDDATYTWIETIVDLAAYEGQNNVQFAFRYTGNDGANFAVDNVTILGTTPQQYTLTVNTVGNGSVNVDGSPYSTQITVDENTSLALQAIASAGWEFSSWSGDLSGTTNPQNLVMDGNKTVTATFTETSTPQYTLTVNVVGSGSVNVDGSPYTSAVTVDEGTVLSLQAIANTDWEFISWSGNLTGTTNPQNLTMNANKSVTATFESTVSIESALNFGLQIYPNPANNKIYIVSENIIESVSLINSLGQTVLLSEQNNNEFIMDISQFKNGMYFIQIRNGEELTTHKIEIKH